jgi:GNAT superfamily N-acetyltransferase
VTELREATQAERDGWEQSWTQRLNAWYGRPDVPAEWAAGQVAQRVAAHAAGEGSVLAITADGAVIGVLAISAAEEGGQRVALLSDVMIGEEHRRQGHAGRAVRLAEDWARGRGAGTIWVVTDPAEPVQAALFAGYPVRARQMIKPLAGHAGLPAGLTGRAMTGAEFRGWRAGVVAGYAADMADSGSLSRDEALAQAELQTSQLLPEGSQTPGHSFLCLEADGQVVATNWIAHRRWPGVSWVYAVEVSQGHRGQGYGRAAMLLGEDVTLEAGDTHLALNVFGHNDVALGLYESLGYRAYEHRRSLDL